MHGKLGCFENKITPLPSMIVGLKEIVAPLKKVEEKTHCHQQH
jgi:hypothetical protein